MKKLMGKYRTVGPRYALDGAMDEEPGEINKGKVAARYPASYHAQVEGDELVIYDASPPNSKTDLYTFDTAHGGRPQTVAALNRLHKNFYQRRKSVGPRR